MLLRLHDLAGADAERRFSPYCWRIRMALAHKGLPVETIPWRFTEKDAIARSGQTRVPGLVDGERWIADSWRIANYLEDTYPDRATLFCGPVGRALSRLYSGLGDALVSRIFGFVALDVLRHVDDRDREYFRRSREERVGMTLGALVADRDIRLGQFRQELAPLRLTLNGQIFWAQTDRSMPTTRCSGRFIGRVASVPLPCWQPITRLRRGANPCPTSSKVSPGKAPVTTSRRPLTIGDSTTT
jgi:glutaredoxin 2